MEMGEEGKSWRSEEETETGDETGRGEAVSRWRDGGKRQNGA